MTLVEVQRGDSSYGQMLAWLVSARLAVADLEEGPPRFLASFDGMAPTAFAGLTGLGPDRLPRSVVVDPERRGRGLGRPLIAAVEAHASENGADWLWLLTDGASEFFGSLGYVRRDRPDAPEIVRASSQFRRLCSSSAVLMCKTLR